MFNPTEVVIEAFVRELKAMYVHTYSVLEPIYPDVIAFMEIAPVDVELAKEALPALSH